MVRHCERTEQLFKGRSFVRACSIKLSLVRHGVLLYVVLCTAR
jgi:hypothetical protein